MKLGSIKKNRDGHLVVVSRDLTKAVYVDSIAKTMQEALDNWKHTSPKLEEVYAKLNRGELPAAFTVDPKDFAAPLPRAYQWADGSAYVNHVELVRKARGAEMPASFWTDPLMYQGASDEMLGPCEPIRMKSEEWGIDFESEVAVILNDTPMGVNETEAINKICLLTLVNDVSLRNLIPAELAKGFGFFQSKPASGFALVAVTPDELGPHWSGGKVHLPLKSYLNGAFFGEPDAGEDMTFHFGQLISHAAKTRNLLAGTIIGSGTVSNVDRSKGSSCIAEKRMLETIESGKPKTPFMHFGDTIKIEMNLPSGESIFGSINQQVVSS